MDYIRSAAILAVWFIIIQRAGSPRSKDAIC